MLCNALGCRPVPRQPGRANLTGADLSGASLWGTNLSAADLSGTNLSYSDFVGAKLPKDLTQDQLDRAVADPDNPPILTDVKDRKTGKPLVWRGASTEQISREDGAETAARRLSRGFRLGFVVPFSPVPPQFAVSLLFSVIYL